MKNIFVLFSLVFFAQTSLALLPEKLPPGDYPVDHEPKAYTQKQADRRVKDWPRAKVWFEPAQPIGSVNLLETQGDLPFKANDEVVCKFDPAHPYGKGKTPKFYCILPTGKTIKVKYSEKPDGSSNKEVRSEVVGSRLLRAIGFPADIVYMPKVVRCFGCPPDPFKAQQATSYDQYADFTHAAIDIKFQGKNLESEEAEGWSFGDLSRISAEAGGATREEIDAVRLLVAFVQNGDSKSGNQTFTCISPGFDPKETPTCPDPVAYMSDLGAMFGGSGSIKFNQKGWAGTEVWADDSCSVVQPQSYSSPSFKGGKISDEGRRFLHDKLKQLGRSQIEDLFRGARVAEKEVKLWADEFERRVAQLNAINLKCPKAADLKK